MSLCCYYCYIYIFFKSGAKVLLIIDNIINFIFDTIDVVFPTVTSIVVITVSINLVCLLTAALQAVYI